ncbi:MAG: phenylacetate-CoA oxygenase/reductase subunit PaaK [Betaproteobacteria bacterium]|nr:phenylacetate-CoA oxygenase/reductase subunit PaaK [Betaproteobacteria bacterium]
MTPRFHRLAVAQVRRETPDAVSVAFAVPPALKADFRFRQGQFLTLRAELDGQEVRRAYSICCSVQDYERDGELRVAIKRVDGGRFSTFANDALQSGRILEVMTPDGRFFSDLDADKHKHYVAFAAGSGITPVLSIIKTTLAAEPASRFALLYGNRTLASVLFCEELEDLKDRYLGRFTLYHVLSRDAQEVELFNGRLDREKCAIFLETLLHPASIDEAFICGPASMIEEADSALRASGVPAARIHVERFGLPGEAPRAARALPAIPAGAMADVTVIADGKTRRIRVPYDGDALLDAALHAGMDVPYACKSGVCCTCRARVLEGELKMDRNYTLERGEMDRGFVLTCQSHPVSERVVVSYDER